MRVARASPSEADRPGTLLDWRFLLPDTHLERVAVIGPIPARRKPMLEALAREATVISDARTGAELDGAVVFGLDPERLRRARAAVARGGWIYLEAGPLRRARRPTAIRSALEQAGCVGVQLHWHWPSFTATDEMVPLEAMAALRGAFTRRRRSGWRGLAYRSLAALARTPLLPSLATDISAVATVDAPRPSALASRLGEHLARQVAPGDASEPDPVITYLTPRYGTSRNVIALVRAGHGARVVAVAKLPRDGEMESLRREASALRLLEQHAPSVLHVPRVLALTDEPGRHSLLETAVAGRVIDRRDLVGDREGWIARVEAWTAALASVPGTATDAPSPGDTIAEALDTLDGHAAADPGLAHPTARARALLAPLSELTTPTAIEHGDLAPPNLLLTRSRELGVVDWELAGPSRVPLHDLVFFLTHLAWEMQTDSQPARLHSVREALLDPHGWGARALARAAGRLGLDAGMVPFVLLASWTRSAATTIERVAWAEPLDAHAGTERIRRVRELRAVTIWQIGVEHLDREAAA